jgi:GntR family transcriptional regulator of vanillate catabolism
MQGSERQTERVILELRRMILAGEFPPGSRVAEIPLAERLGVSRTPVRLALEALERDGLVTSAPRRGFAVREITVAEIVDAYEVRGALEGLAARLAVERGIAHQTRVTLQQCVEEGDRLLAKGRFDSSDIGPWSEMNARLHAAIIEASRNEPLASAHRHNSRLPLVAAGPFSFGSDTLAESYRNRLTDQEQHRDIVDAMLNGQAGRAEALLKEHSHKARENLKAVLARARERQGGVEVPGLRLVVG